MNHRNFAAVILAICLLPICLLPVAAWAGLSSGERQKSALAKALNLIIATTTPQLSVATREKIIRDYEAAPLNKAQAVQLTQGRYWRSSSHESQDVAGDRALEGCQMAYGTPCALLAVNDEMVSDTELLSKDMPRLQYSGQFDLSKIPAIRETTRNQLDLQQYWAASEPKAIAIHPWGRVFVSSSGATLQDAATTALAKCNNDPIRKNQNGPCYLYALNKDVVLPKRLLSFQ